MVLNLFARLVAASTLVLIFAGGLVTSTGSGLAVPDWPNTYGWFMFSFPLEKMVGGILYEHGHRLIATTVGFLILILAAWLWRAESRGWVRRLGYAALAAVIVQGVLGGITVLWFLPDPVSIAHAGLAQIVFCLTIAIALFTSTGWQRGETAPDDRRLQRLALVTTIVIYAQILVGATMRHTDAGLAIPDFPLAFGHIVPNRWDAGIAVHFAHRAGALIVSVLVVMTLMRVWLHHAASSPLRRPANALLLLLVAQVTLGAYTIWTAKQFIVNSAHVATGAMVLATSLVLTLRAYQSHFVPGWDPSRGRFAATDGVAASAQGPTPQSAGA